MRWNPWHGCRKISDGCLHCYVYRIDSRIDKDASEVKKNISTFNLPIAKNRRGEYKYPSGTLFYTCFTSDFFLDEADGWRDEAWKIIKERRDCRFFIITKRIDRFDACKPVDWGDGYDHVTIAVTTENQKMADYRLPIYLNLPIKTKVIICEPLLEPIDLSKYLTPEIKSVSVGGESGDDARICDYDWVLGIREQCMRAGVGFSYHQTGAKLMKNGKLYHIPKDKQEDQAHRAGIDVSIEKGEQ
ncbi:MAG: DUF5131 family protein [Clostridia bacterium]|nr:DUF5131 family protein [Clostridia bacterium]